MSVIESPASTKTFGNMSYVVLTAKPANLAAVTAAEVAAGENITCHMIGDWWATSSTEKITRARRACQVVQSQGLGPATMALPALQYTVVPQSIGTPAADGNEAYEVLPPSVQRYFLVRIGKLGTTDVVATDKYVLYPIETSVQTLSNSQEDAGGEATVTQDIGFISGYTQPIHGVVAA